MLIFRRCAIISSSLSLPQSQSTSCAALELLVRVRACPGIVLWAVRNNRIVQTFTLCPQFFPSTPPPRRSWEEGGFVAPDKSTTTTTTKTALKLQKNRESKQETVICITTNICPECVRNAGEFAHTEPEPWDCSKSGFSVCDVRRSCRSVVQCSEDEC